MPATRVFLLVLGGVWLTSQVAIAASHHYFQNVRGWRASRREQRDRDDGERDALEAELFDADS